MSRPTQSENGVHGAPEPPNVYHPQADSVPSYDAYADPATAHGWQNAYDETRELPPVPVPAPVPAEGPEAPGGRARTRRDARRDARRPRRVAVAAGAAGVLSVAALVVSLTPSGSSSDGSPGKGDRVKVSTAGESTGAPAEEDASASPEGSASATTAASPASSPASPSPTSGAGTSASRPVSSAPATTSPAATSVAPSTTPTTGPKPGSQGRGHGATKRPK
ncbi:hypothetical protein ABZT04_06455 [Streptomyces sp. NPDC005492]|uniref:hypothetical protein n=1 Tax=Streptomyces sp. NPDC005492 TaxID=3156883 RepID=UPI0033B73B57